MKRKDKLERNWKLLRKVMYIVSSWRITSEGPLTAGVCLVGLECALQDLLCVLREEEEKNKHTYYMKGISHQKCIIFCGGI